ncbi:hypothetical protein ANACOL_02354 [Anaerotruncus colihominis DSM 17241]|uniref:Uncharacterized protein n=1 Tax=Anaerotruncus colihominis DSM 17241 TaxID=445972 RepID=B0PC45_9FIRM|nr:hypothetical protein ANACOL_02354 [Anaerotruncus colihominis DSM 17241]
MDKSKLQKSTLHFVCKFAILNNGSKGLDFFVKIHWGAIYAS